VAERFVVLFIRELHHSSSHLIITPDAMQAQNR
jgi:hypothetical protein